VGIIGNGACQGDLTGKVKTRQIGFIRQKAQVKTKVKASPKVSLNAGNKITNFRKK